MRSRITSRRWRRALLGGLLATLLSGTSLAASSVSSYSTPSSAPAKPHTAQSRKSRTHKTSGKTAAHKTSAAASHGKKGSKRTRTSRKRGQQVIDHDRARAIQEALIREHYLNGEPSGTWDAQTQAAMQRYQADQGWQSKTTPDSRALIKLGLGPSNDHLLNPESAMTSAAPADPKSAPKQDPPADTTPHR
jgi:peptidoglycan hydrolase-like protein with peptidoglycan-binding domain